jgi:hypothetical protein
MSGHKDRLKLIKEAFDANVLAEICMAPESYFEKYGSEFKRDGGKGKFAFYCKDTVSDVLGIAHMDSVCKTKDFGIAKYVSGKELVMSPTLDDRLGVYVICELLPKLGIHTDLLLTTDEESGNSTAKHFKTDKKYKWMFQFDRTGDDVVMYQYDTPELRKRLEDAGLKCASGSASDISKLSDLGCSGMNFGVGYYDYHWERAYADLNVTFDQVAKFMKFYRTNHKTHLIYDKTAHKTSSTTTSTWGGGYSGMGSVYMPDWEGDHARRVGGTHYTKMVWDEDLRLFVPNRYLYRNHPTTKLPTWDKICDANERWSTKKGIWELADGKMTEDELFEAIMGVLKETGHGDFVRTPREKRYSQSSILESDDDPKSLPGASSNGSSSGESISGSLSDDPDSPCRCGHSRFVHHRTIWRKGGQRITDNACDWWKCSCAGFEDIETVWPDTEVIVAGI